MKVGQNIGFIDISDEFENGPDLWKKMAASGQGIFNQVFRRKRMVIRLANAGGLAGGLAGWRAGGLAE
ncbi:hypothetical protein DPMN_000290 [Dreissena polymorpha]|uniref:Uncharacterized protein n=1 Tax=Dreissena polymorpha TaxID=45954 RepID=A0A9D4MJG0_DREPO|nr:hypothetical protein DPMN_000290 [Dreissena polymorpha]